MRIATAPNCLRLIVLTLTLLLGRAFTSCGQTTASGPAGAVILIIRHAEKPDNGSGLSDDGTKRANAYPGFFQHFKIGGASATPNYLFATRDSENSQRPRLTLQPLSAALHLPVSAEIKNKDFAVLANMLKGSKYGGQTILICWHHGHIPDLLLALGADPARLLPQGKWPETVYGWLIWLRYDQEGKLKESAIVNESLEPSDSQAPPPGREMTAF